MMRLWSRGDLCTRHCHGNVYLNSLGDRPFASKPFISEPSLVGLTLVPHPDALAGAGETGRDLPLLN